MTDYHVHIGQFDKAYYFADRVFSALKASGVDEVYFSSTTLAASQSAIRPDRQGTARILKKKRRKLCLPTPS